jgi:hypothetical protein
MFDEMAPFYRPFKYAKRNSDRRKIQVLLPPRRDASRFPFRFISPWATTALSSTTNTLSHTATFKSSSVDIFVDKPFQSDGISVRNIPWNLAVKKYALLS